MGVSGAGRDSWATTMGGDCIGKAGGSRLPTGGCGLRGLPVPLHVALGLVEDRFPGGVEGQDVLLLEVILVIVDVRLGHGDAGFLAVPAEEVRSLLIQRADLLED